MFPRRPGFELSHASGGKGANLANRNLDATIPATIVVAIVAFWSNEKAALRASMRMRGEHLFEGFSIRFPGLGANQAT